MPRLKNKDRPIGAIRKLQTSIRYDHNTSTDGGIITSSRRRSSTTTPGNYNSSEAVGSVSVGGDHVDTRNNGVWLSSSNNSSGSAKFRKKNKHLPHGKLGSSSYNNRLLKQHGNSSSKRGSSSRSSGPAPLAHVRKWIEIERQVVPGLFLPQYVPVSTLSEEQLRNALERRARKDKMFQEKFSKLPPINDTATSTCITNDENQSTKSTHSTIQMNNQSEQTNLGSPNNFDNTDHSNYDRTGEQSDSSDVVMIQTDCESMERLSSAEVTNQNEQLVYDGIND